MHLFQELPSQLHTDLSSDEPLNSIPSRVPVSTLARSDDQPQPVRERQPRRSRPNKPNPIASSQLAIPKQPARIRSRFILVVRFLQSAKQRCMSSSTRSNKDKHMIFSEDPAHLEHSIRKDQRSTSIDATTFTSTDSCTQPSTDT
ncbi:hypothetical protein DY000_02027042 [Brassica cretica]|uniref:Uncharacterized protein n=1 Tax=Brassica cretica TaxID=69181 RepID=A0ABQ7E442_BRACR|nr:hypothetical protein DY000_02027042 [Brassica cretica]